MKERNLLIDKLKEYLKVLKCLRTAAGRALVKRIKDCICQAELMDVPHG